MSQTYIDNKLTYVLDNLVKAEKDIRFFDSAMKDLYAIFKYPREWNKDLICKLNVVSQYLSYFYIRYELFDAFIRQRIDWVLSGRWRK